MSTSTSGVKSTGSFRWTQPVIYIFVFVTSVVLFVTALLVYILSTNVNWWVVGVLISLSVLLFVIASVVLYVDSVKQLDKPIFSTPRVEDEIDGATITPILSNTTEPSAPIALKLKTSIPVAVNSTKLSTIGTEIPQIIETLQETSSNVETIATNIVSKKVIFTNPYLSPLVMESFV